MTPAQCGEPASWMTEIVSPCDARQQRHLTDIDQTGQGRERKSASPRYMTV
jgi:hypothetical protein